MNRSQNIKFPFFLVIMSLLLINNCGNKQNIDSVDNGNKNRKSGIAITSIKHENTYVKVVYGQPYRRGRTIFGDLQPYGEVWRTGANEATEITITEPILMNMNVVSAGTYSLFTIPREDSWTIILNNGLGQWGAFNYTEELDALRFDVPVIKNEHLVEAFTIEFSELQGSLTTLTLAWEYAKVEIPIRFY